MGEEALRNFSRFSTPLRHLSEPHEILEDFVGQHLRLNSDSDQNSAGEIRNPPESVLPELRRKWPFGSSRGKPISSVKLLGWIESRVALKLILVSSLSEPTDDPLGRVQRHAYAVR